MSLWCMLYKFAVTSNQWCLVFQKIWNIKFLKYQIIFILCKFLLQKFFINYKLLNNNRYSLIFPVSFSVTRKSKRVCRANPFKDFFINCKSIAEWYTATLNVRITAKAWSLPRLQCITYRPGSTICTQSTWVLRKFTLLLCEHCYSEVFIVTCI